MSLQGITVKGYTTILFIVAMLITIIALAIYNPAFAAVTGGLLTISVGVAEIVFKPFRPIIDNFTKRHIRPQSDKCRILLVGLGRSGKTSIIKRFLTVDSPQQEESTQDFHIYEESKRIGLQDPHRYLVSIADYQGQKPSQIMVNSPSKFFGPKGNRMINTVVFVVDPFSEVRDKSGEPLEGEELIEALAHDTQKQIQERIESQLEYVTKYTIELIFSAAFSTQNLFAVRLLINKADLLKAMIARGCLPDVDPQAAKAFMTDKYQNLINKLEQACEVNGIDDFSVHLVSAHTGENIQEVFSDIVEKYHRRKML
ncbi:MAG: hypothetical protein AAF702_23110 [Chloroflexota bacterium]